MHEATLFEIAGLWSVLAVAVAALVYAFLMARSILREDPGTERMQEVSLAIRQGAVAYLNQQLRVVMPIAVFLAIMLFLTAHLVGAPLSISIGRGAALLAGATCSLMIGQVGLRYIATQGNVRVANEARQGSFRGALRVAYRSGTVAGMLADGFGLLGGTTIFLLYREMAPQVLLGFGLGGTLLALFMRVGGGIYTKAADVGADLVGKIEMDIPEDDPRNAAVIADLVGDNVGDFSGMAEDVFESYEVTIVSAMILGLAIQPFNLKWIVFPLLVRAIGVISSIIGTYAVSLWPEKLTHGDAFKAMDISYDLSSFISTSSFLALAHFYVRDLRVFAATAAGVLLAIGFNKYTSYFTHPNNPPVRNIARASQTGAATVLLSGLATGYESTVWAILIIVLAILLSVFIYTISLPAALVSTLLVAGLALAIVVGLLIGRRTREVDLGIFSALGVILITLIISSFRAQPHQTVTFILYSVALAGIGMLTHTGNNVSMDAFGPICDNAAGIAEICREEFDDQARSILAALDAVGNTTKAITKGIAIASAVIAAVALFGVYITDIGKVAAELGVKATQVIDIADPLVFVGLLIGGALPFMYSSICIRAVERAASLIIHEVRRQFRIPGILEGTVKPDYARVVNICTVAAQKELLSLGILAVLMPIFVGFLLKEGALGGFLAGIILTGQLLAVFMANAGGAWDNAKKLIEDGWYGGKGSEAHKAAVVGDTVGDPLKDTAGPSMNPMIKVVNLVSVILTPLMVRLHHTAGTTPYLLAGGLVLLLIIGWAIRRSKREVEIEVEEMEAVERAYNPSAPN